MDAKRISDPSRRPHSPALAASEKEHAQGRTAQCTNWIRLAACSCCCSCCHLPASCDLLLDKTPSWAAGIAAIHFCCARFHDGRHRPAHLCVAQKRRRPHTAAICVLQVLAGRRSVTILVSLPPWPTCHHQQATPPAQFRLLLSSYRLRESTPPDPLPWRAWSLLAVPPEIRTG